MSEFVDHLHEVFAAFGPIRTRPMFGGHGVYHDDLMFGLVANDVLYLKADKQSAPAFEAEGLERFIYVKQGNPTALSYYAAPESIFDDPDAAREWATRAYSAALRAHPPKAAH